MDDFDNSLKDLQVKGNEYVRTRDLLTAKQIEKHIENSAPIFFRKLGINAERIKETKERTPDYSSNRIDFEVTAIHQYLPKNTDIDNILKTHEESHSLICVYLYLEKGKPKLKIIHQKELGKDLSILCLRHHISLYESKIFNKIDDKYHQSSGKDQIIIMDFRLAHFDPLSLKRGITKVLKERCIDFSSLIGIIANIPKKIDSNMLEEANFFFVKNPYFKGNNDLISILDKYSMVQTDIWTTPQEMYVKVKSGMPFAPLCMDCPEKADIEKMGLPTI